MSSGHIMSSCPRHTQQKKMIQTQHFLTLNLGTKETPSRHITPVDQKGISLTPPARGNPLGAPTSIRGQGKYSPSLQVLRLLRDIHVDIPNQQARLSHYEQPDLRDFFSLIGPQTTFTLRLDPTSRLLRNPRGLRIPLTCPETQESPGAQIQKSHHNKCLAQEMHAIPHCRELVPATSTCQGSIFDSVPRRLRFST